MRKSTSKILSSLLVVLLGVISFGLSTTPATAAPTIYFYDSFDEDHGELSTHTPDTGTSWTQLIDNGVDIWTQFYNNHANVQSNTANAGSLYQANTTMPSADYEVSSIVTFAGGSSSYPRTMAVRIQDANNMYIVRYTGSSVEMYKRVAGVWTKLGDTVFTTIEGNTSGSPYHGDTVTFRIEGSTLSFLVEGTTVMTRTDSDISAAGLAGMGLGYVTISSDDGGTGVGVDNFTVQSIVLDATDPTIDTLSPADNATAVAVDSNLVITFSEVVDAEVGNITIYDASDDSTVETIDVTSGQVTGSGTDTITINPSKDLDTNGSYYVQIAATAFDDEAANSFAGISDTTTWSFETVPSYTVNSCSDWAALPSTADGDITLATDLECETYKSIALVSHTFDGQGYTILLDGAELQLFSSVTGGIIQNLRLTGSIDGGDSAYEAPLVGTASGGATIRRVASYVAMSNVGSYSSGLVAILNNSTIEDSFVAGDVSSSDANYIGGIAGYIINDALIRRVYMSGEVASPGARIGGLVGLMNGTGATATSVIRDSFVVGAVSGHSTLSAALVGLIGAEISWPDDSVLINNYYDATRTGKTVCAIADTNLTDEAGVCVAVNTVASPDTGYFDDTTINDPLDQWNFSSVWVKNAGYPVLYETVNPLLTSVSPADNATSVAVDADLALTFAEPVEVEAGSVLIKRASDDGTAVAFDVTTDSSGSGSRTITLASKGDLEFATDYYVEIQATAFDDISGNSYVGIADSTTWNFTTRTASPPTVTTYTPAHGATGVAADTSFTLTFNEAVEVGTGSLYLRKVSYGVLVETIDVASSQISGSGTTAITITPSANLEPGVAYYFEVDATAFDSVAGADFAGFTDSMTWSFTMDASSATGAAWWPGSAPLLPGSQNTPEISLVSQPAQDVAPSHKSDALCLEDTDDLLRRGDEGSMVALLQTALVILGDLDIAGLTGQFGPLTQSAVLSFQAKEGLAQDGVVGPLTFDALSTRLGCTGSESATQPRVLGATHTQAPEEHPEMVVLRYGATGQPVAHLQNLLGKALGRELQTDGVFGVATESAVREWQKRWGLVVDGIVGQATWASLRATNTP